MNTKSDIEQKKVYNSTTIRSKSSRQRKIEYQLIYKKSKIVQSIK